MRWSSNQSLSSYVHSTKMLMVIYIRLQLVCGTFWDSSYHTIGLHGTIAEWGYNNYQKLSHYSVKLDYQGENNLIVFPWKRLAHISLHLNWLKIMVETDGSEVRTISFHFWKNSPLWIIFIIKDRHYYYYLLQRTEASRWKINFFECWVRWKTMVCIDILVKNYSNKNDL